MDELSYREAMDELEGILEAIESDEVDLDALAANVERASELIAFCRTKIEKTEEKVVAIVKGLDGESS